MVDCTGLENRRRETARGFESHTFRQQATIMQRRSFLRQMLVASAAPAIVRSSSLTRLWVPDQRIIVRQDLLRGLESILDPSNVIGKTFQFDALGEIIAAEIRRKTLEPGCMRQILQRADSAVWRHV